MHISLVLLLFSCTLTVKGTPPVQPPRKKMWTSSSSIKTRQTALSGRLSQYPSAMEPWRKNSSYTVFGLFVKNRKCHRDTAFLFSVFLPSLPSKQTEMPQEADSSIAASHKGPLMVEPGKQPNKSCTFTLVLSCAEEFVQHWFPCVLSKCPVCGYYTVRERITQEQQQNWRLGEQSSCRVVDGDGPSVEAALSTSPTEAIKTAEPRKATIGARKPAGAKKGGVSDLLWHKQKAGL